jgi:hypothetical protein
LRNRADRVSALPHPAGARSRNRPSDYVASRSDNGEALSFFAPFGNEQPIDPGVVGQLQLNTSGLSGFEHPIDFCSHSLACVDRKTDFIESFSEDVFYRDARLLGDDGINVKVSVFPIESRYDILCVFRQGAKPIFAFAPCLFHERALGYVLQNLDGPVGRLAVAQLGYSGNIEVTPIGTVQPGPLNLAGLDCACEQARSARRILAQVPLITGTLTFGIEALLQERALVLGKLCRSFDLETTPQRTARRARA